MTGAMQLLFIGGTEPRFSGLNLNWTGVGIGTVADRSLESGHR